MSQSEKQSTRMSAGLATFVRGLSENESAATRALLLIGADHLGIDPTFVADDLRLTIMARLPAEVYAILMAMWNRVDQSAVPRDSRQPAEPAPGRAPGRAQTPVVPAEATEPAAAPELLDPFSHVGFDFDETA